MSTPPKNSEERLFLGILLRCCNVYARLYLNANKTAYAGHCPKCAKPMCQTDVPNRCAKPMCQTDVPNRFAWMSSNKADRQTAFFGTT